MRKLIFGLVAFGVLGCGGDSTGPGASAVGTWKLQTVNGSALPYTVAFVASPPYRLEIVDDTFVASANGTYTESFTTRETDGSTVTTQTDSDNGTWTQNDNVVTITASDGTVSSATISGDIITASESGFAFVFRRQ